MLRYTKVLVMGGRVSTQLLLCCFMKRFALALGLMALGAPAMAGGIEGGVKNSYFNNFRTETINFGTRNIEVDSFSEVTWHGQTESHKSFQDFMGQVNGTSGSYDVEESFETATGGGKGNNGNGYGRGKDKDDDDNYGGGGGQETQASAGLSVEFGDPKVQFTFSEGWTNTSMTANGYDTSSTKVNIYEEYEGYSESSEHGHEATSFASAF